MAHDVFGASDVIQRRHMNTKTHTVTRLPNPQVFSGFHPVFPFFFGGGVHWEKNLEKPGSIFTDPLHGRCSLAVPESLLLEAFLGPIWVTVLKWDLQGMHTKTHSQGQSDIRCDLLNCVMPPQHSAQLLCRELDQLCHRSSLEGLVKRPRARPASLLAH